ERDNRQRPRQTAAPLRLLCLLAAVPFPCGSPWLRGSVLIGCRFLAFPVTPRAGCPMLGGGGRDGSAFAGGYGGQALREVPDDEGVWRAWRGAGDGAGGSRACGGGGGTCRAVDAP